MTRAAHAMGQPPDDRCNGLAEKRAFLMRHAWTDAPPPVCIETHASLVFLTKDHAYKLKKPVVLPHADMRGLTARAALCAEELRLNRALSGDVYRGLVALVRRPDGTLALGGAGRVVDWLVQMRRLPQAQMLDKRLAHGPIPSRDEIAGFGQVMIAFYRQQLSPPRAGRHYLTRLQHEMTTDLAHLAQMRTHLGDSLTPELQKGAPTLLAEVADLILARGKAGLVFEGHGDLRAEHVCLTHPPLAFDRVEFNHDFRLLDPHDEIAGLGLECAIQGAGWIGPSLCRQLAMAGFVPPPPALARAYLVARCLTQARLAIDHLRDPAPRTPAKWAPRARRYLAIAHALMTGQEAGLGLDLDLGLDPAGQGPLSPPHR